MPKKNIREMSVWERKRYSLEARTFHTTLRGAVVLGLVALLIGLGLYAYALAGQYVGEAYSLTRNVEAVVDNVVDIRGYGRETMRAYREADRENREKQNVRYLSDFAKVRFDENFNTLINVMREFTDSSDVDYLYAAMYDEENSRLVYIADPDRDKRTQYKTGMWSNVDPKEVEKFLNAEKGQRVYHISYDELLGWICTSGVPIFDQDGSIACFILADVSLAGVLIGMRDFVIQYVVAMAVVVLILGYVISRHMKKTIVDPVNSIAAAAERYVNEKRSGAEQTNCFEDLAIDTGDEIENLYFTLSDMEKDINGFEKDLTKVVQERERIGTEMSLAMRIQNDVLPSTFPAFPDRTDFDIHASMIPAKEVGGDFYDYFFIDEDHLAMLIADVSGKGVPAALFMMASKILLDTTAMEGLSPAAILEKANERIARGNSQEMFVTVWLGIIELSTGKLTAANAGHEYPIIRHADRKYEVLRDRHGFVIGGMEGMKYHDYEIQMEPGSDLFVYTDGICEATDTENRQYGLDRLLETLNSLEDRTPKTVSDKINRSVKNYTGEAPQFDDVTLLAFHYTGPDAKNDEAADNHKEEYIMKEMTLEATVNNIPRVTDFVNAELEALDCPMKAQMQIDIAIDELFGNIAQYAYDPLTGPATVRVEVGEDPMAVIITFIDHGKPYDPLAAREPDITLNAEEREIGGLGVFLVKKTMDEITYEYKDGQNILRIKKTMQEGK